MTQTHPLRIRPDSEQFAESHRKFIGQRLHIGHEVEARENADAEFAVERHPGDLEPGTALEGKSAC